MNKRITSLLLALVLILGAFSTVFAVDTYSVYNLDGSLFATGFEMNSSTAKKYQVNAQQSQFLYGFEGKYYSMEDAFAAFEEAEGDRDLFETKLAAKDEAEVTQPELTVESVSAITHDDVTFGDEEGLDLPETVTATLNDEDETEVTLNVEWDENEDYDVNVAGEYTFTGTATIADEDAEYTLSEELAAVEVSVKVLEPTAAQIAAAVAAVNDAEDNDALLLALQSPVLGLEGVNEDLIEDYETEIDKSVTNTKARIQAAVNRVNKVAADELQVFIDAVNNAVGLDGLRIALRAEGLGLDNVSTDDDLLFQEYFDAIDENDTDTKAKIQDVIDAVNLEEITAAVVKAETDLTEDALTAAAGLVDLDLLEEDVQTDLEDRLDAVEGIMTVNGAEDAGALLGALNDLEAAELLTEDSVVEANEDAYFAAFEELKEEDEDFKFTKVAEIQAFVDEVNATEAADKLAGLIADVNNATTATELYQALEALETEELVENLDSSTANQDKYFAKFYDEDEEEANYEFKTVAEIQAFVDEANLEVAVDEVNEFVVEDPAPVDLFAALGSDLLDLDNLVERNEYLYASELAKKFVEGAEEQFAFKTVAEIQAFVDAANATPVGKVNVAKNTAGMRAALENPALELDLAVYNELSSLQKNQVAKYLLDDGYEFEDTEEVQEELDDAISGIISPWV